MVISIRCHDTLVVSLFHSWSGPDWRHLLSNVSPNNNPTSYVQLCTPEQDLEKFNKIWDIWWDATRVPKISWNATDTNNIYKMPLRLVYRNNSVKINVVPDKIYGCVPRYHKHHRHSWIVFPFRAFFSLVFLFVFLLWEVIGLVLKGRFWKWDGTK